MSTSGGGLPDKVRELARDAVVEAHLAWNHAAGVSAEPAKIGERTRRIVRAQTQRYADAAAEVVYAACAEARSQGPTP